MKKISIEEEFAFEGYVWIFIKVDGKVQMRRMRSTKVKASFNPPLISQVEEFFKKHGGTKESAIEFWQYYDKLDWRDKNNNLVKNWKAKVISVWLKNNKQEEVAVTKSETKEGFMF